jgi:hypothetical protein
MPSGHVAAADPRSIKDATGTLSRAHATQFCGHAPFWVAWACDSMPVVFVYDRQHFQSWYSEASGWIARMEEEKGDAQTHIF